MRRTDIHGATHVELKDGSVEPIASKWGIDEQGRLAPPSQGGFGCVTKSGKCVSMWDATTYWAEVPKPPRPFIEQLNDIVAPVTHAYSDPEIISVEVRGEQIQEHEATFNMVVKCKRNALWAGIDEGTKCD